MRRLLLTALVLWCGACRGSSSPSYLFLWAGDAEQKASDFEGTNCGVPLRTGDFWLQTVPDAHAIVVLDIRDPEQPREVSRVSVGDDEAPHSIAMDRAGRRVVMNSGGNSTGNRLSC